jgi:4-aminobutyrate aminotransferase-like enzyme
VRGLGLFLGIELVRDRDTLEPAGTEATQIVERMKERGVLLSTDRFITSSRSKPPLVFQEGRDVRSQRIEVLRGTIGSL